MGAPSTILVVENEDSLRLTLSILLRRAGYEVREAPHGQAALDLLAKEPVDLVITDLRMEPVGGLEVLRTVKVTSPQTEVLVLTGFGSVESAVEAMKLGAFEYLTKPFDREEMLLTVAKALERKSLLSEVRQLRAQVQERFAFDNIVCPSARMQEVLDLVARVAESDATVLLEGESGTGKELIARALHHASRRREGPFVAVNCGALPESLLESELFGHVKGSFTGATSHKKGLFEEASGGTILLDEISETTPSMQVKLLRVLQEQEVRRVGSNTPVKIDTRVVAATNRHLTQLVAEGTFREELFYRLNVIIVTIPPLRDRPEDVLPLAEHFLKRFATRQKKPITGLSREAALLLGRYPWPGNVRELENAIERAVVLTRDGEIQPGDLPLAVIEGRGGLPAGVAGGGTAGAPGARRLTLREMEKAYILEMLNEMEWNQAKAAQALDIGRNTLWRKLKEYGIKA
jgi:DNA-binding NtrC family response regulator